MKLVASLVLGLTLAAHLVAADAGRITLFNGDDLKGWRLFLADNKTAPSAALVSDGIIHLSSKLSGYLITEKSFSNYHLHVEWRWPKDAAANANSGVMVHLHGPDVIWPLSFECQLKNGNAGQVVGMGLDIPAAPIENNRKRAAKFVASTEKPLGEWNTCEIYARDATIEVFINSARQNFVEKLPVSAGGIALQLEGFPIDFRNVWLEPLKD